MSAIFSAKLVENALLAIAEYVEGRRKHLYLYAAGWAILSPVVGGLLSALAGVPGDVVSIVIIGGFSLLVFIAAWVNEGNIRWLIDELWMAFSMPDSKEVRTYLECGGVVDVMGVKVFYMKRGENFRSLCERTKDIKGINWALIPMDVPFVSFRYEGMDYAFRIGEEPFTNKWRGTIGNNYEEYLDYVRYFLENLQVFISERMLSENPSPSTLRKIISTALLLIFPVFCFPNPLQEISQVMRNKAVEVPPANSRVEYVFRKDYDTYLEFRLGDGLKDYRRLFASDRHRLPAGASLLYVSVDGKEVAKNPALEQVAHVSQEPRIVPPENIIRPPVNVEADKLYETGVAVTENFLHIVSVWVDRLIFFLIILLFLSRFVAKVTANEVVTIIDGYLFKNSMMLKINNVSISITAILVIGTVILVLLRALVFMLNSGWNKVGIALGFFVLCFVAERVCNRLIPNPRAQRDEAEPILPPRSNFPNRRDG